MPRKYRLRPRNAAANLLCALGIAGLLWVGSARPASACSCIVPPPPREELAQSDLVFTGIVTAIERDGYHLRVRFDVDRVWKGEPRPEWEVFTASSSAACGVSFERGVAYLVYAHFYAEEARYTASLCSRTRRVRDAAGDLAALGDGHPSDEVQLRVHPNPFSAGASITYSLTEPEHVRLAVYDVRGRLVATLADRAEAAGDQVVHFDAGRLTPGVYLCVLDVGAQRVRQRMVRVR